MFKKYLILIFLILISIIHVDKILSANLDLRISNAFINVGDLVELNYQIILENNEEILLNKSSINPKNEIGIKDLFTYSKADDLGTMSNFINKDIEFYKYDENNNFIYQELPNTDGKIINIKFMIQIFSQHSICIKSQDFAIKKNKKNYICKIS